MVPFACSFVQTYLETVGQEIYTGGGIGAPPGDGSRLFVSFVQFDQIKIVDLNTKTTLSQPFLSLGSGVVSHVAESGFLGFTFDPDYANNGYLYVSYSAAADNAIHVVRYRVSGDPATSNVADPNSAYPILRIEHPNNVHFSGWLGFSPVDGYLYMTVGDGGGAFDSGPGHTEETGNAQDITDNLLGKVLRLDVHGDDFPDDPARNYAIPATNPFIGKSGDDEIFAYGLRNAWCASFDQATGDLWLGDVGQDRREEVDLLPANSGGGQNYGWRCAKERSPQTEAWEAHRRKATWNQSTTIFTSTEVIRILKATRSSADTSIAVRWQHFKEIISLAISPQRAFGGLIPMQSTCGPR